MTGAHITTMIAEANRQDRAIGRLRKLLDERGARFPDSVCNEYRAANLPTDLEAWLTSTAAKWPAWFSHDTRRELAARAAQGTRESERKAYSARLSSMGLKLPGGDR